MKFCTVYLEPGTLAVVILETDFADTVQRVHRRPNYDPVEAQLVADWLNGQDQPLQGMVGRRHDRWDPELRYPSRPTSPKL